uniref:DDE Tnp4 domain-containing protein n=1 Tax=Oreochromis niloticus TaxID=8128 RepID=I3IZF3_ORENI
ILTPEWGPCDARPVTSWTHSSIMRPDFRLSRESVTALLNRLNQERRHGWGALIEALVFLFWLASGAAYRVVSRVFAIPRATVHCIVHRVTEEVVATRHQVIHLPRTPEDLDAMSNGFAQLAGHRAFVKAAGAIDCCHVRIKNRKLFPSIILQAVCDHQGRFVDTHVGWPGSVPDSRVLRHSPLYRQARYPPPRHFILADGGYPCLQHPLPLITPYKRPVHGTGAQHFNAHHSRARSVIDAGGAPHHPSQVITACAVLHNICIGAGDIVAPDEEPEDDAQDEGETGVEAVSGAHWRDQLSAEVSALEEVPPDHDYCQQSSIP